MLPSLLLVTDKRSKVILIIYIFYSGSSYVIILGANRRDGNEAGTLRITATRTIIHPQYNPRNLNNDIALIQLPSPPAPINFTSEYCYILMNKK